MEFRKIRETINAFRSGGTQPPLVTQNAQELWPDTAASSAGSGISFASTENILTIGPVPRRDFGTIHIVPEDQNLQRAV